MDKPINKPKRNAVAHIDRRAATMPEKGSASEDPKGGSMKIASYVALIVFSLVLSGCASSPEKKAMRQAETDLRSAVKNIVDGYAYECEKEAAEVYPVTIATYDKEVFAMVQLEQRPSGGSTTNCTRDYLGSSIIARLAH